MKLHAEIARTLADLDAATERAEKHWIEHVELREDIDLIASRLVRQCPLAMIVDALGKTGLRNLRRLIDIDPTYTRETTPKTTQRATGRPSPVDVQPVKQTRKVSNTPTHPKGWESVEA